MMQSMQSLLSFEEYSAWCMSRKPPFDPGHCPVSLATTVPPDSNDSCPVTVRSANSDHMVITPQRSH